MIRDLLKWVAPGLATVLGGTALSLAMTSANIANDLGARSASAMRSAGYDWAELSVDMRDLTLAGTTTDPSIVAAAALQLANLSGVRSVATHVTLAPLAKPYLLQASVEAGQVSISGGVPDEATRQLLLARAGITQGALELRSGMPERRSWLAGALYAIDQLKYFDQGRVTVSDLTVSLNGRAKTERAFRDLLIIMRAGAPSGVTLGDVTIVPALISPYQWKATSDGARISIEGFVPDEALISRWRSADAAGLPVATGLALGSGEPAGFAELSQALIEQLAKLEYGSATITDGASTLTGAPATLEIAQAVIDQLQASGSIVVLEPPRIEDYWVTATRQPGGLTVFDGYAPDEATRAALGERQGADITWLKLGRGAPERFQSAVDFGLAALEQMSEGRFALRDNVVTLSGVAQSSADYETLLATMSESAPQGLVLARAEILAPRAARYEWTATKAASGIVALSGMAPNPDAEAILLASSGQSVVETMVYASGEPNNFIASAEAGLTLLGWLSEGKVAFDGSGWLITGTAKTPIDKGAIEADFVARQLAGAGWSMAVAAPAPTIPAISPYIWSATRTESGVTLTGYVPSATLQRSLAVHAGDGVADTTELGDGAPEGFVATATAALDAVLALDQAEALYDGTSWSLTGNAASAEARDATLAALSATTDTGAWSIDVSAPDPVPVATVPYIWSATKPATGPVTLRGLLPGEALQRVVAVRAGAGALDQTTIDPTAPTGFADDVLAAIDVLAALTEGTARFDGTRWSIEGTISAVTDSAAIDAALARATTPADAWQLTLLSPPPPEAPVAVEEPVAEEPVATDAPVAEPPAEEPAVPAVVPPVAEPVAVPPVAEPEPQPAAQPEPQPTAKLDIAACQGPLADFSARNAILFQSGAAIIAAESEAALDELATDLGACPNAVIHIEGHTDTDGDEQLNLALSVARAEAVVAALVARGVAPARLYAVGYGESTPIADNESSAGKRLNRRIVVTVSDDQY